MSKIWLILTLKFSDVYLLLLFDFVHMATIREQPADPCYPWRPQTLGAGRVRGVLGNAGFEPGTAASK